MKEEDRRPDSEQLLRSIQNADGGTQNEFAFLTLFCYNVTVRYD